MADERWLYLSLPVSPDREERNRVQVDALAHPGIAWFSDVLLVVPSWYEFPNAVKHPLVRRAVANLHWHGVRVCWGRWGWVAFPSRIPAGMPTPDEWSHLQDAYYAALIATVRAEARELGVEDSCLDMEVYGNAPPQLGMKSGLSRYERNTMYAAIEETTYRIGPVPVVIPYGYPSTTSYTWPVSLIGAKRVTTTTYYATDVEQFKVSSRFPKTPDHYSFGDVKWVWGVHVGAEGEMRGEDALITQAQIKAMDFNAIRSVDGYENCVGPAVYIGLEDRAARLREWTV